MRRELVDVGFVDAMPDGERLGRQSRLDDERERDDWELERGAEL